jgi:hypothetical protein
MIPIDHLKSKKLEARSGMHVPILYYRCHECEREFVAPLEGYNGLCKVCQSSAADKKIEPPS